MRGHQIGGIKTETKLRFDLEKAKYSTRKLEFIDNDSFLNALLDLWDENEFQN